MRSEKTNKHPTDSRLLAGRVLLVFLIFTWCVCIFLLSGESAEISGSRSGGFLAKVKTLLASVFGETAAEALTVHILRKAAHIFLFFVLSLLCMAFTFTIYGNRFVLSAAAMLFCFMYAESDEIHQIFVSGRAGMMRDVFIDMIGSVAGAILMLLMRFLYMKIKKHRSRKKTTVAV